MCTLKGETYQRGGLFERGELNRRFMVLKTEFLKGSRSLSMFVVLKFTHSFSDTSITQLQITYSHFPLSNLYFLMQTAGLCFKMA